MTKRTAPSGRTAWPLLASWVLACDGGAAAQAADAGGEGVNRLDVVEVVEAAEVADAAAAPVLTVSQPPTTAPAGSDVVLSVQVTPAAAVALEVSVRAGGGAAPSVTTDAAGRATVVWTLGVLPVLQRLRIATETSEAEVTVEATRDQPLSSAPFGDVVALLDAEGSTVSTEDLVVVGDRVVMGAPGGLLEVSADGKATRRALTGEPPKKGWGVAATGDAVWVVDLEEQRLVHVDSTGQATTALSEMEAGLPFDGINDVEVGPDGAVFVTDPCLARIGRYDPPAKQVTDVLLFDASVDGGPNGMTFDADGRLYYSTENTSILCGQPDVAAYDAKLARIERVTLEGATFGGRELIAEGLGVFGDGLTMDVEGNLYAVIDQIADLALAESAVWVFPGGRGPGQRLVVAEGVLYANVAFGRGALGETTLYLALLAAPPFTGLDSRGLQRVEIGVSRAPWLSPL